MSVFTAISHSLREGIRRAFGSKAAGREAMEIMDKAKGLLVDGAATTFAGNIAIGGTLDVTGAVTIGGDVTLGSGDDLTLNSADLKLTNGSDIVFSGGTGTAKIRLADNLLNALEFEDASGNNILAFVTETGNISVQIPGSAYLLVSAPLQTDAGVGALGGSGITVVERGDGNIHKSVFTLTDHSIAITDAAAAGAHGSTAFYTFPEGHVRILGAHINLTAITAGAGGIADDAVLDIGVGQAAAGVDNDELTGTEADILHLDEVTLAAGAATGNDVMGTTPIDIDGSATAGSLKLNVAVDADNVDNDDTLTVTGTITIFWIHQGDD